MTYYNSISNGYSELHKQEQLKKIELIKQNLRINPTDLLLDLGCGPYFGSWGCRVIGLDSSLGLLKQASIPTVLAKAEHLPFKDHCFDKIISITAIHNFDDPGLALQEANRVGKEDFVFSVLKKSAKAKEIEQKIKDNFTVIKRLEEDKDIIFVTKQKKPKVRENSS